MEKVVRGELDDEVVPGKDDKPLTDEAPEVREVDLGVEPPVPEFILDIPNISAIDL